MILYLIYPLNSHGFARSVYVYVYLPLKVYFLKIPFTVANNLYRILNIFLDMKLHSVRIYFGIFELGYGSNTDNQSENTMMVSGTNEGSVKP